MTYKSHVLAALSLLALTACGYDEPLDAAWVDGEQSAVVTGSLRVAMLDVGQADSIAILAPGGCAALIDGGATGSGTVIKSYLASLGVTNLDFVVASHMHADHIGGIDEIVSGTNAVTVDKAYDRGGSYSSTAYTQYNSVYSGKRVTATPGMTWSLCNQVTFEVFAANAKTATSSVSTTDENARSVVIKMSYGAFDMLLGGDVSDVVEPLFASSVGEVEAYKVHHHGSRTSSSTTLLNALEPTVSLISVGYNNSYGHPHDEAIARLNAVGTVIYQTEDPDTSSKLGNIVITSTDGSSYTVTQGGGTHTYASKGGGSCTPNCSGKTCGDDGCGGSCGTCGTGYTCSTSGQCLPDGGGDGVIENGETITGLSAATHGWLDYTIAVPAGATNLVVSTSGGTGDLDLYVRFGAQATTSIYDCRSWAYGNAESCTIASPSVGTYYISLYAYAAFANASVTVSYTMGGDDYSGVELTQSSLSGSASTWKYYNLSVPSDATSLTVAITGGSGDADLYVRSGSNPTLSSYSCRPYLNGNNETCTISSPGGKTWYIGIYGYASYSGVTLTADYE